MVFLVLVNERHRNKGKSSDGVYRGFHSSCWHRSCFHLCRSAGCLSGTWQLGNFHLHFAAFSRQSTPDKLTLMMVLTLKPPKILVLKVLNVFSVSNGRRNGGKEHEWRCCQLIKPALSDIFFLWILRNDPVADALLFVLLISGEQNFRLFFFYGGIKQSSGWSWWRSLTGVSSRGTTDGKWCCVSWKAHRPAAQSVVCLCDIWDCSLSQSTGHVFYHSNKQPFVVVTAFSTGLLYCRPLCAYTALRVWPLAFPFVRWQLPAPSGTRPTL